MFIRACGRALLLATLCPLATLRGQSLGAQVLGRVFFADSATGAAGIVVVASDPAGRVIARALSGDHGEYLLPLPRSARYQVRALRIGFRPTVLPSFELAAAETRALDIVLREEAVALAPVTVRGESVCRAEAEPGTELAELLVRLQRELFVVGAELATAPENRRKLEAGTTLVTSEMVAALEPIIDDVTTRFEAPQEFVLPGENRIAAALDVARTVVRRAEREAVAAAGAGWLDGSFVVAYLNRLADLVYTLARWQEGAYRPVRLPSPDSRTQELE